MRMISKISALSFTLSLLISGAAVAGNTPGEQTHEFDVNGLKVIHRPSTKDVISVRFFVEGGVGNYPENEAGIENLAFALAMDGGTKTLNKDVFSAKSDSMGTYFNASSDKDYGNLNMLCLKEYWDGSWNLFTDAIMNPAMPQDEFTLLQKKMISGARSADADPDSHLRDLVYEKAFPGQPYSVDPEGTEKTLGSLQLQQVADYYRRIIGKKRCFLVVVGNVTDADLKAKVEASLAKLPEGTEANVTPVPYKPKPGEYVENRDISTNYIMGTSSAPLRTSPENVSNSLAMSILYDRFFEELRTKRSLSYAPSARPFGGIRHRMNAFYITTTDPKQSMEVMTQEIDSVKALGFKPEELKGKKLTYLTYHYMGQEQNADISMSLGVYEVMGDWHKSETFTKEVMNTSLADVNKVFKMYNNNINWVYLGKESDVKPADFVQPKPLQGIKK